MFCGSKKSNKRNKVKLDTISLSSVETSGNQCFQEERLGVGRITQGMLAHCNQQGLPICRQDQFYPYIDSERCSLKTGQLSHFSSGTSGIGSSAMGSEFSSRLGSRTSSKCGRCGGMNPNIPYPGPYAYPPHFMQGPTSDLCESNSDRSRSNNGISGPESDIFDNRSGSMQGNNQMLMPQCQPMHTVPTQPMHTRPLNAVAAHMQRLMGNNKSNWNQSESSWSQSAPFIAPDSHHPDEILVGLLKDLENYQQNGCMCGDKYCEEYGSQDSLSTIDSMKPTKEWVFGPETARVGQAAVDSRHLNRTCLSDDTYATSEYSDTTSVYSSCSDDDESDFTDHMVVDSGSAWHMYVANREAQSAPTRIPAAFEGRRVIWTKGQLKVEVYVNHGLLTVHVIQARHLSTKGNSKCNPFVKVSLVPDHQARTRCKTQARTETYTPVFDEKFSFELLEEDYKKRILISVWHQDKRQDELLGCMSFGILPILLKKKTISGWYYLLTEDLGRTKHLQVISKETKLSERVNQSAPEQPGLLMHSHHMIMIERGERSFGFTVTGVNPVMIGRVHPDSPAEAAGLMKGDYVISVNRLNVTQSPADSVAKIIKHAERHVVLEIQRAHRYMSKEQHQESQAQALSTRQAAAAPGPAATDKENQPTYAKVNKKGEALVNNVAVTKVESLQAKKVTFQPSESSQE